MRIEDGARLLRCLPRSTASASEYRGSHLPDGTTVFHLGAFWNEQVYKAYKDATQTLVVELVGRAHQHV